MNINTQIMSKALEDMSPCPLLHCYSINQHTHSYNQHSYLFTQQINKLNSYSLVQYIIH